jgi:pimeloyl-ACP methyl ester carboxylesterase
MTEHIDRYPWIRDRAIFVGNDQDIVPGTFGGKLPAIRDWTTRHFSYSGYITGFTPPEPDELPPMRSQLGYRDDELVCVVAVGGSGVGQALIDKVVAAYPLAKKAVPELRMIVVTGPRIDPAVFPQRAGLELRGYVHRLYQHLCVCDLAIVQGGLQTDPHTILRGMDAEWTNDRDSVVRLGAQVRCPALVIQGSQDAVVGPARGAAVADAIPHARLITLEGCGHAPHLRDPVRTNLLIRDFVSDHRLWPEPVLPHRP